MASSKNVSPSPTPSPTPPISTRQAFDHGPSYGVFSSRDDNSSDNATANDHLDEASQEKWKDTSKPHAQRAGSTRSSQTQGDRRLQLFRNWWQEMAASLVALAALLALLTTLYAYVDQPSPEWPRWISINTTISLYVVLIKTSIVFVMAAGLGQLKWTWFSGTQPRALSDIVLYDDASRGALGGLFLLWALKDSHVLSSVGALITVVALATEPFAQQIVRYYDCSVPTTAQGTASLPRTTWYAEQGGLHTSPDTELETIVPGIVDAINAGVFNPTATPPDAKCTTGNCTWTSEYSSVGWCSSCQDITDQLSIRNISWAEESGGKGINGSLVGWNLTSSLPSGLSVDMCAQSWLSYEFAIMGPLLSASQGFPAVDVEFILGKQPDGPVNPNNGQRWAQCTTAHVDQSLWTCQGYGASLCSLYPCVKTYTASTILGVLNETVVDSVSQWGHPVAGDGDLAMIDTACVSSDHRETLEKEGYHLPVSGKRWMAYSMTPNLHEAPFLHSMMKDGCVFAIDEGFLESVAAYFKSYFAGQVSVGQLHYGGIAYIGDFAGPEVVQAIFNSGNVTFERMADTFANVSTALTNYMRANGKPGYTTTAVGVVEQNKTCIAVQWPWLSLPSVLVLLTWLFLILVLLETRPTGERREIWKNSPLALIYHGLSDASGGPPKFPTQDAKDRSGMEKLAKKTKVRLGNVGGSNVGLEMQGLNRND